MGRFVIFHFMPREVAGDGSNGVLEANVGTALKREDCPAIAASMIGELIIMGDYDPDTIRDDEKDLAGKRLEDFAREAYEIIKENILFFTLLNIEARKKIMLVLNQFWNATPSQQAAMPQSITLLTLDEVDQLYSKAESIVASLPKTR